MTTFARIAKILKGLVEPRNWVEEAFAEGGSGGGSGVLIVHEDENRTLDKTWQQIHDSIENSAVVIYDETPFGRYQFYVFTTVNSSPFETNYTVLAFNYSDSSKLTFKCNATDGYPVFVENH